MSKAAKRRSQHLQEREQLRSVLVTLLGRNFGHRVRRLDQRHFAGVRRQCGGVIVEQHTVQTDAALHVVQRLFGRRGGDFVVDRGRDQIVGARIQNYVWRQRQVRGDFNLWRLAIDLLAMFSANVGNELTALPPKSIYSLFQ